MCAREKNLVHNEKQTEHRECGWEKSVFFLVPLPLSQKMEDPPHYITTIICDCCGIFTLVLWTVFSPSTSPSTCFTEWAPARCMWNEYVVNKLRDTFIINSRHNLHAFPQENTLPFQEESLRFSKSKMENSQVLPSSEALTSRLSGIIAVNQTSVFSSFLYLSKSYLSGQGFSPLLTP